MSMTAFLLAMQAAGMVMDVFSYSSRHKIGQMGLQLQNQAIETNLSNARLQSEQQALVNMQALRKALGAQMVIQAARGTDPGLGSAFMLQEESRHKFDMDERIRKINLMSKEANIRAQGVFSQIQQLRTDTQLGSSLVSGLAKTLPISSMFGTVGGGSAATAIGGSVAESIFGGTASAGGF